MGTECEKSSASTGLCSSISYGKKLLKNLSMGRMCFVCAVASDPVAKMLKIRQSNMLEEGEGMV